MDRARRRWLQALILALNLALALTLLGRWLQEPIAFRVGAGAIKFSATTTQVVKVCPEEKKLPRLVKFLAALSAKERDVRAKSRVMVFCNRVQKAKDLHAGLLARGFKAEALHGDVPQEKRQGALLDFRGGKAQILVSTDVAARGIHISNLPFVVNYDFPQSVESYAHRVGRTGRQGENGHAFSYFTKADVKLAPRVVAVLKEHHQQVDANLDALAELAMEHLSTDAAVKEDAEEQRRRAYNADFSGGEEEPADLATDS